MNITDDIKEFLRQNYANKLGPPNIIVVEFNNSNKQVPDIEVKFDDTITYKIVTIAILKSG